MIFAEHVKTIHKLFKNLNNKTWKNIVLLFANQI